GGEPEYNSNIYLWKKGFTYNQNTTAISTFGRLFSGGIHIDVIIRAFDGSIGAHRALVTARLPIFDLMFTHELKEKDLCVIEIPEMSIKVYQPFLSYLYSNKIQNQGLLSHRLDLLRGADTYDVFDMKDVCQDILIEDIDSENVMERLQTVFRYHLLRLKICCIDYLVKVVRYSTLKMNSMPSYNLLIKNCILLEAVASYDLWIWHAFFGVAGANNDLTVLNNSPLFDDLLDGIDPVAPFECNGVTFEKGYYLADDIYPQWASFVKSFTVASSEKNVLYKRKQEGARKDIERAFGVLQGRWRIISQPACAWTINKLRRVMHTYIILHNMILQDQKYALTEFDEESYICPPPNILRT
ncbi:ALP1-like protein isoform X1, partial [Tanacetum coccineum]